MRYNILLIAVLIMLLIVIKTAHAEPVINMDVIHKIESSNGLDKSAYVLDRYAIGKHQVSRGALQEYNERYGTKYTVKDLLDDEINYNIATWYANVRSLELLRAYHIPITRNNMLACYNIGIGNLIRKKEQQALQKYINKYEKYSTSI